MPVKTARLYTLALIVADTLAFLAAFAIAYKLRVSYDSRELLAVIPAREFMSTFLILVPFWLITFMTFGLYSPYVSRRNTHRDWLCLHRRQTNLSWTARTVLCSWISLRHPPIVP